MRKAFILFIIYILSVSVGCTPLKRVTKTETVSKTEVSQTDSTEQITRQRLDILMRSVAELRESMSEWTKENIDYTENRYDSLGRLVSSIRQTTNRDSGREAVKTDNTSTYVGVTLEQVDSLFSSRVATIKQDMRTKEVVKEKIGLSLWQKLLCAAGLISIIIRVLQLLRIIFKKKIGR